MIYDEDELIDKYFEKGDYIYERQIVVHSDELINAILMNLEFEYTEFKKNNKIYYNIKD